MTIKTDVFMGTVVSGEVTATGKYATIGWPADLPLEIGTNIVCMSQETYQHMLARMPKVDPFPHNSDLEHA